jgi:lambda family phage portal protein
MNLVTVVRRTVGAAFRAVGTELRQVRAEIAYESASVRPRLATWRASAAGPNAALGSLSMLRVRSRDLIRNNGYADSALAGLVANIVGTGITPRFRTPDRDFNRRLAEAWDEWTDESDADGRLDFYGQQALACRAMVEGGECFARFRPRRANDGLSVPLQIQLLEGEYCPEWMTWPAPATGNRIISGVEFDRIGRRAIYYFFETHPGDLYLGQLTANAMPLPVSAAQVVHLADVRRPGMVRGEPWLTRALVKLKDLDKYDDAQLIRQQIAALFAGFVEEERPEDFTSEGPTFAGQGEADLAGVALAPLEPGTMQTLLPGRKITFSTPPSPGDSYGEFMKEQRRAIAAAAGILYEMLSGDYTGLNDRTWRAAVSEFRRRCQMWQHHLVVFQFCRPILARWVDTAILAGRIEPAQGITPAMIARALGAAAVALHQPGAGRPSEEG